MLIIVKWSGQYCILHCILHLMLMVFLPNLGHNSEFGSICRALPTQHLLLCIAKG